MNIKLLTPISHLFNEVNTSTEISEISDELEARERTCEINLDNTTHYHIDFDLNIGLTQSQIDFLNSYVKPRENIQTLTFQAARDCNEVSLKGNKYFPKSKPIDINEQIENTEKSLKIIKNIVGEDRKIGIENNNYYPTGAYDICTSTDYLIPCFEKLGLHLLFDVAHAIVTCTNKRISFKDYRDKLLSRMKCKQIHLCEPTLISYKGTKCAIDSHGLPSQINTQKCIDILLKWKIQYLTIEYYRDADHLINYLSYLRDLIKN